MITRLSQIARRLAVALALALVACHSEIGGPANEAVTGKTLNVAVGQEFDITLQTVGSGSYDSIPFVSSSAVQFLDAALVAPYVPAGPTQRFRFRTRATGRAVIIFRHSGTSPLVSDTVKVH